jgi:cell division protein FtsW
VHKYARILLIISVLALLIFGISMLYSTTYAAFGESLLKKQLMWIGGGILLAALIASLVDYRQLTRRGWWILGAAFLPLGYLGLANILHHAGLLSDTLVGKLPLVTGLSKGSLRWFQIWKFSVQPSEFAKLAIILFLAGYLPRHARHMRDFYRGFLKPLGAAGIVTGLILLGGDLSSTAITGSVVFGLAFIGGVRLRYLALSVLAGLLLAGVAIKMSPERMSRITSYRDPERFQKDDGYQLWYSQLAIGSGGLKGLGFTNSRMKRYYLPEAHTDFIVAIVGEEWGYLGIGFLILAYSALATSILWIGVLAPDREGALLCAGIGLLAGLQALVNISVVSGFCPTTGVTAPFVSYGGSSIVATLLGIGLVLNVSRVGENEAAAARQAQEAERREPLYRRRLRSDKLPAGRPHSGGQKQRQK